MTKIAFIGLGNMRNSPWRLNFGQERGIQVAGFDFSSAIWGDERRAREVAVSRARPSGAEAAKDDGRDRDHAAFRQGTCLAPLTGAGGLSRRGQAGNAVHRLLDRGHRQFARRA